MDDIIAETIATAVINAPIESIDLAEWLFTLKSHEYRACSTAHIAAGNSVSEDGRRMSINVEQVADTLLIQHYIEEIGERNHCRVNSISDSVSSPERTKLGITWELKVRELTNNSCELSNKVIVRFTNEFLALLKAAGITNLTPVKAGMTKNVEAHNKEETPLFAKDIEQKALNGVWKQAKSFYMLPLYYLFMPLLFLSL